MFIQRLFRHMCRLDLLTNHACFSGGGIFCNFMMCSYQIHRGFIRRGYDTSIKFLQFKLQFIYYLFINAASGSGGGSLI